MEMKLRVLLVCIMALLSCIIISACDTPSENMQYIHSAARGEEIGGDDLFVESEFNIIVPSQDRSGEIDEDASLVEQLLGVWMLTLAVDYTGNLPYILLISNDMEIFYLIEIGFVLQFERSAYSAVRDGILLTGLFGIPIEEITEETLILSDGKARLYFSRAISPTPINYEDIAGIWYAEYLGDVILHLEEDGTAIFNRSTWEAGGFSKLEEFSWLLFENLLVLNPLFSRTSALLFPINDLTQDSFTALCPLRLWDEDIVFVNKSQPTVDDFVGLWFIESDSDGNDDDSPMIPVGIPELIQLNEDSSGRWQRDVIASSITWFAVDERLIIYNLRLGLFRFHVEYVSESTLTLSIRCPFFGNSYFTYNRS